MSRAESEPPLVLGIDGGGTKTVAWLASGGADARILGRGFGGPSNQRAVGPVLAMNGIETAVAAAFLDAGRDRCTVSAACLGLAGADRESDRRVVEHWAHETRLADRIQVVNDALPLLYADGMSGHGVALIAGTGSLAVGHSTTGQMARSGGWGWLFGDEGSAFALGRAVLQAVTRAADGRGPATLLMNLVLDHLRVASPSGIVAAVYASDVPRSVIAELAPLVFAASRVRSAARPESATSGSEPLQQESAKNDIVATQILDDAASQLAELVISVVRRLAMPNPVALAMTGAVLVRQDDYRRRVVQQLDAHGIDAAPIILIADAVTGAVALARKLLD